jgi:hypothetical protein
VQNGGKRRGAGRKPGKRNRKTIAAQVSAAAILKRIGEAEAWRWAAVTAKRKRDVKTYVDILKYLTDRRDGKPRQAIEATGPNGGAVPIKIVSYIARPDHAGPA